MKNPLDLRRQAAAFLEEAKGIQEKAEAENRATTEQEDADIVGKIASAESCSKEATKLESLQRALDGLKKDVTPPMFEGQPNNGGGIPAEPRDREAEARQGWKTFGEFARAVYTAEPRINGMVDNRLMWAAASGMQQAVGSEGGFAVPPAFGTTIWDALNSAPDSLLGRTDQYTVEGESLTLMANAETNRTAGYRYGGVRGYWIAEADQITSSKPKLRQVKLEPQQLGVLCYATDKLLKNAVVALDQWITKAATDEILFNVNDAIINGNGVGQPKGILSSDALISVTKETGQAAKTVVSENIVKMWARLHPRSRGNAIWLINVDVEPQLYLMTIGVGTSGLPSYMPPGGLSSAPYATLMGRPVIPVEYCPTLGTVGDILLTDLSAYITGVKGGVESAVSMHLRFDYAEQCFRFLYSIDGQPWCAAAITPFKGSNTLSPYVALATRA